MKTMETDETKRHLSFRFLQLAEEPSHLGGISRDCTGDVGYDEKEERRKTVLGRVCPKRGHEVGWEKLNDGGVYGTASVERNILPMTRISQ